MQSEMRELQAINEELKELKGEASDDSFEAPVGREESRPAATTTTTTSTTDSFVFDLGGKRRVTVSKYAGKKRVDIREFYEDKGELKPGKKGISLSLEQYELLKSMMPRVDDALKRL